METSFMICCSGSEAVFHNNNSAKIALEKGIEQRFKLLDVAVGPLNL